MDITLNNDAFIAMEYLSEQERRRVQIAIERLRIDKDLSSPNLHRLDRASDELYDVYVYRVDPMYRMLFRRQRATPTQLEVVDVVHVDKIKAFASPQAAH